MQSKTSWFNKEMLIQSFRSVGWVSIIYLVGLLLTVPLQVLMDWSYQNDQSGQVLPRNAPHIYYFDNIFQIGFGIQLIMMVIIPVLLAVFLYRFLQVKQASDFIHSLPLKRNQIYMQYFGIGCLFLIIPVLVTALLMAILHGVLGLEGYFTLGSLAEWVGLTIVLIILLFSGSVMIATVTGLSAVHGVMTYIMFLFPAGILALFYMNAKYYFYGYDADYFFNMQLEKYSPITSIPMFHDGEFTIIQLWIYIGLILLFFVLGLLFYQYRKLEGVSQPLVFHSLKPIFKYGVTFCVMLVGGAYFAEVQSQGSLSWLIVGYVIGSIIGYLIAEMVLHKTWRVFTHLKGYVLFAIVTAVAIAALQYDITGFETRVPDVDDVESVYIGDMSYAFAQKNWDQPDFPQGSLLTKKENINKVRELHNRLIEQKNQANYYNYEHIYLAYQLENGDQVVRHYRVQLNENMTKALKPIYESMEYKEKTNNIFQVNADDVIQVRINQDNPFPIDVQLKDPKIIAKAIKALKTDVMNEPYNGRNYWVNDPLIEIYDNHHNVHLNFNSNYANFKEVLKEAGVLEDVRVTSDEVKYAVVVKSENSDIHHLRAEEVIKLDNSLMVKDSEKLQTTLDSTISYYPDSPYVVMYMYSNEHINFATLDENNLPDFVKKHFE